VRHTHTHDPRAILGVEASASPETIHAAYKRLALLYHPDRNHGDPTAEARFKDVTEAYQALTAASTTAGGSNASSPSIVKLGAWEIVEGLRKGGIADLYRVRSVADSRSGILKIVRSARDNALLAIEAEALKRLSVSDPSMARYFPSPLDSFEASGRRVNVISTSEECLPLSVIRAHFSAAQPIDFRHVVWMGNRLFEALGIAHRQGIVHGAVLPQHLLFRPGDHGLVIVDWTCATFEGKRKVPYLVPAFRNHYPPEILAKRTPAPGTDIFMAMSALSYLAGKIPIPRAFRPLFEWGLAESPSARPADPWTLLDKWRAAATATYGEPRFIPLVLPSN